MIWTDVRKSALKDRARRMLSAPLFYHVCRAFPVIDAVLSRQRPLVIPPDAAALNERSVLTSQKETGLFVRMNYHKFHADLLRSKLSSGGSATLRRKSELLGEPLFHDATSRHIDEIEGHLSVATEIRDQLVRVFLKLAISLVRPHLCPQHSFETLLSEAGFALWRAVEKYDPDRGFRFSTYATTAIRRALHRRLNRQHTNGQQQVSGGFLNEIPEPQRRSRRHERRLAAALETLDRMLAQLNQREQSILRSRFGLEHGCQTQSLQQIAARLGISRERVRQLEGRAIQRLRTMPEAETLELA